MARLLPGFPLWPMLPVVHGHVQVFAFAVLMTIGVLYWFLPRLWGCPAPPAWRAQTAFILLFGGLLVVLLGFMTGIRSLVVFGAVGEGVGAACVVGEFANLLRRRKEPGKGSDPAMLAALGSTALALPLAYVTQLLSALRMSLSSVQLSYMLAFYGVLVPVALAMSSRLFPLYFRTRLPERRTLAAAIVVSVVGLYLRLAGDASAWHGGVRLGCALQAAGIVGAIAALRMLAPREKRPAAARVLWRDPTAWLVHIAYASLAADAVALVATVWSGQEPSPSLEWHLVGVGYVTCLIAGVGTQPASRDFARRRPRSQHAGWVLLGLLAGALLLRLWAVVEHGWGAALSGTSAGILGVAAMAVFAWNVGLGSLRHPTK